MAVAGTYSLCDTGVIGKVFFFPELNLFIRLMGVFHLNTNKFRHCKQACLVSRIIFFFWVIRQWMDGGAVWARVMKEKQVIEQEDKLCAVTCTELEILVKYQKPF